MLKGMVLRAWQTVKPHVPLIKFRKGGISGNKAASPPSSSGGGGGAAPKGPSTAKVTSGPVIEDFQLPKRYKREPLGEQEIDAINSGGAY